MKKLLFVVCAFLCLSPAAFAGQFGPAQPLSEAGGFSLGTGIFYYSADWDGDLEVSQVQGYVQGSYALTRTWEIYGQVGAADFEVDGVDFEDGYRPFGTVGLRALLAEREPVSFGAFVQGSYFANYEDEIGGETVEMESHFAVDGGLVLQTWIEGALLYGGPVFYVREADINGASMEEESNFGGFVGIRWPLKSGVAIELESQFKTGVSVGGAVHYLF